MIFRVDLSENTVLLLKRVCAEADASRNEVIEASLLSIFEQERFRQLVKAIK